MATCRSHARRTGRSARGHGGLCETELRWGPSTDEFVDRTGAELDGRDERNVVGECAEGGGDGAGGLEETAGWLNFPLKLWIAARDRFRGYSGSRSRLNCGGGFKIITQEHKIYLNLFSFV